MLEEKYSFKEIEAKHNILWENSKIYKWNGEGNNTFTIDTPPPTISGKLHIGHIFSYCHTDFIARFQRMLGKDVFYPIGFDDNGLPTE
ncbi:class I tRNA ligase family protein, partial [Wolbachia endosymbiont of Madathamugadia hiepei]|uniref:class I tRNA ligase family protein n=1 Tax=Wolbachia endosymbiont of Madathamugadia hiepei TaxID=1241303 RepID=UPI00158BD2A3